MVLLRMMMTSALFVEADQQTLHSLKEIQASQTIVAPEDWMDEKEGKESHGEIKNNSVFLLIKIKSIELIEKHTNPNKSRSNNKQRSMHNRQRDITSDATHSFVLPRFDGAMVELK